MNKIRDDSRKKHKQMAHAKQQQTNKKHSKMYDSIEKEIDGTSKTTTNKQKTQ